MQLRKLKPEKKKTQNMMLVQGTGHHLVKEPPKVGPGTQARQYLGWAYPWQLLFSLCSPIWNILCLIWMEQLFWSDVSWKSNVSSMLNILFYVLWHWHHESLFQETFHSSSDSSHQDTVSANHRPACSHRQPLQSISRVWSSLRTLWAQGNESYHPKRREKKHTRNFFFFELILLV